LGADGVAGADIISKEERWVIQKLKPHIINRLEMVEKEMSAVLVQVLWKGKVSHSIKTIS